MEHLLEIINHLAVTISTQMIKLIKILWWTVIIIAILITGFTVINASLHHISWLSKPITQQILFIWIKTLLLLVVFKVFQWCYQKAIEIIKNN